MSDWKDNAPSFYKLHDASPILAADINQPQRSTLMNDNQVEGTVNKVAGRIQDAAGALTGDAGQQIKGKARAASGDAEARAGDFVEQARAWTVERPLSAVLIAAGLFYVIGRISGRRD